MAELRFPGLDLLIGDPDIVPLSERLPSAVDVLSALDDLILSASGWRKVFAADGDEESLTAEVSVVDRYLAACMALAFAEFVQKRTERPVIALGIDSRPSGPAIADTMTRVFLARGLGVMYPFIVAAPEIMAWTRAQAALPADSSGRLDAFCYVSASHNPPGHNGVKFGLDSGGVLSSAETGPLAERFKAIALDPDGPRRLARLVAQAETADIARVYSSCLTCKRASFSAYALFAREVASGTADLDAQAAALEDMAAQAGRYAVSIGSTGIGVVAEMNGSARSVSVDESFLEALGIRTRLVNATPRGFAHRIVPEGESLEPCRAELERAHATDPGYLFGYVPDCDGDRGNLVVWDDRRGAARPLEAQETFALCVLAELADVFRTDAARGAPVAVVANDATSMRVEAIARRFGAEVRRAETGEANVVALAASLRERGYYVRILGEGSNGGNITHPSSVRDPMATLSAMLKLVLVRDSASGPGLFHRWLDASGRGSEYRDDFTFADVLASLPAYVTTSVFEERAALTIVSTDQALLKRRYQSVFERAWPAMRSELKERLGVARYLAVATNGTQERCGLTDFGEAGRGGLKVLLVGEDESVRAFLWMRGSGTEPVLRVMADVAGSDPDLERWLLGWHVAMTREADAGL